MLHVGVFATTTNASTLFVRICVDLFYFYNLKKDQYCTNERVTCRKILVIFYAPRLVDTSDIKHRISDSDESVQKHPSDSVSSLQGPLKHTSWLTSERSACLWPLERYSSPLIGPQENFRINTLLGGPAVCHWP